VTAAGQDMVVLGFDFGMRRIGVAIGNLITATAAPLETLDRNGSEWDEIAACIAEWQPRALIVGLPYNADGSKSEMTRRAQRFARQLSGRFGLPVHEVDERWTSLEAAEELRQQRRSGARRKRVRPDEIDRQAARLILESWLSNRQD
jgi:putative Holliday junction resolvase